MNLTEIEAAVGSLDTTTGFEFIYELLGAYGFPRSSITRLRDGAYDLLPDRNDECLWRKRVHYRRLNGEGLDPHAAIDASQSDPAVKRANPRFLVVHTDTRLLAVDSKTKSTLDIAPDELKANAAFFMPWAGIEKTQLENVNYADVKAAEKMAELYVEITNHNNYSSLAETRTLNIFFSRLLFCYFAEDTGIFPDGAFTNAIGSLTQTNGSDTNIFLDSLFDVLDTEKADRIDLPTHFEPFGWVNGSLFDTGAEAPTFTAKARKVLLDLGEQDWSKINPDIFGSMIQAVVQPGRREGLGMHYTSVENILRVLRPLFLDDLSAAIDDASTTAALQKQLDRIARVKVFDPACGSGNFLVIAYKELRRLEHEVLVRIAELEPTKVKMFTLSVIRLENFYGIEIDDFAHEVAILSLWLAKHQMNREFHDLFGVDIPLIPLKDAGSIVHGNATRMEWSAVCPPDPDTYICSNPPYHGSNKRPVAQTNDMLEALEDPKANKTLDYVSAWLYKGAKYVAAGSCRAGLVTTNSIAQGKQVGLLWSRLFVHNVEIGFAHTSFKWTNNARGKAGVTCVIIGLQPKGHRRQKPLYTTTTRRMTDNINPYLVASSDNTIVHETDHPITPRPEMVYGNMPRDGGHLVLTSAAHDKLLTDHPEADPFVREYLGALELIRGVDRYCLWIAEDQVDIAMSIPAIRRRVDSVAASRSDSPNETTREWARKPHRFVEIRHRDAPAMLVPRVSSERRTYAPIGFVDSGTIASDLLQVVYDAELWLFGLLQSKMHMAWLAAVGGRMKTDYRYSSGLVYNTFPFPKLDDAKRQTLTRAAMGVIAARERFSERSLKELYDPDLTPPPLARAHDELDAVVDGLYRKRAFESDGDRLAVLLKLYTELTTKEG